MKSDLHIIPKYYDWAKTFTYGTADIVMVVGMRGVGKTYGLRKQFIKDAEKGFRFVEIVRHKDELKGDSAVQVGYFDKLAEDDDLKGKWVFKTQGVHAYMAKAPADDERPDWQCIGYFVALSDEQNIKKRSNHFVNVKRIVFDEFTLRRDNPWARYLPNEYAKLAGVVDSVTRERADNDSIKPTVYLLGNAIDITNPYFAACGIAGEPKRGYSWHRNKTVLLHYLGDAAYARAKAEGTVAGRMLSGTAQGAADIENRFALSEAGDIAKKTPNAKLQFIIAYNRQKYGVWLDYSLGYYYITTKAPNAADVPTFALTNADMRPNYVMIQAVRKRLQGLAELYYLGIIKYDTERTRDDFLRVLSVLGIRYQ